MNKGRERGVKEGLIKGGGSRAAVWEDPRAVGSSWWWDQLWKQPSQKPEISLARLMILGLSNLGIIERKLTKMSPFRECL